MDRVAKLAKEAAFHVACEDGKADEEGRKLTRELLARRARVLGFPENEISTAIDTALGGR